MRYPCALFATLFALASFVTTCASAPAMASTHRATYATYLTHQPLLESLPIHQLLDAIRQVETGGLKHPGDARGDGGAALGPYQIHKAFWHDSGVPGTYQMVVGDKYSRRVILAYWKRFAPAALARGDLETLARVHNGGCGFHRASTNHYWQLVHRALHHR